MLYAGGRGVGADATLFLPLIWTFHQVLSKKYCMRFTEALNGYEAHSIIRLRDTLTMSVIAGGHSTAAAQPSPGPQFILDFLDSASWVTQCLFLW